MRLPVSDSLFAKLATSLRFNSIEMMLWTWLTAQFLVDDYYENVLQTIVKNKESEGTPLKSGQSQIQTEVLPMFINSTELVIATAVLTKVTTTAYEFGQASEESKEPESAPMKSATPEFGKSNK